MKLTKGKKALIIAACVLILLIGCIAAVANHYLNKIDFDDGSSQTAPSGLEDDDEEDIFNSGKLDTSESSELSKADESIKGNLDDSKICYSDEVTNILVMGIDYGSKKYPYGRSDSMIVVSINKTEKKIKLISLSRTAYAAIAGYNNTRLSHAHGYGGPQLAIKAVEQNYKIRIDNYVSTNFESFKKIIDAFGGIKITLTAAEARYLSNILGSSSAGTYTLNGTQALAYARTRKIDSDRDRTGRQRKVLIALSQKAKSMSITSMIGMLDTILPLVRTDMSKTQLISQAANALSYLSWDIQQEVVPHKSSGLVLRGGFEVVIVDWADEVKYVRDLLYSSNEVKYEDMK